ncbi:MAG: hypothetical protein V3T44_05525 [bacterium]
MVMYNFEVTFSYSGTVEVHAEDEADAIQQVQQMASGRLLNRIDPESLVVHAASEVDVGGTG